MKGGTWWEAGYMLHRTGNLVGGNVTCGGTWWEDKCYTWELGNIIENNPGDNKNNRG